MFAVFKPSADGPVVGRLFRKNNNSQEKLVEQKTTDEVASQQLADAPKKAQSGANFMIPKRSKAKPKPYEPKGEMTEKERQFLSNDKGEQYLTKSTEALKAQYNKRGAEAVQSFRATNDNAVNTWQASQETKLSQPTNSDDALLASSAAQHTRQDDYSDFGGYIPEDMNSLKNSSSLALNGNSTSTLRHADSTTAQSKGVVDNIDAEISRWNSASSDAPQKLFDSPMKRLTSTRSSSVNANDAPSTRGSLDLTSSQSYHSTVQRNDRKEWVSSEDKSVTLKDEPYRYADTESTPAWEGKFEAKRPSIPTEPVSYSQHDQNFVADFRLHTTDKASSSGSPDTRSSAATPKPEEIDRNAWITQTVSKQPEHAVQNTASHNATFNAMTRNEHHDAMLRLKNRAWDLEDAGKLDEAAALKIQAKEHEKAVGQLSVETPRQAEQAAQNTAMNNVKDPVELDRNPSRATTNSESSVYHDAEDFAFPGETFHPTGGFGSLPLSRTHSINQDHVMTSEEPVSSLPKESKTLSEKQVKDLAQALAERKRTGQNDETDMDFWSDRKQNGEIIKEDNDFDFRTIPYGGSELKPGHFEGPGVYGSEFHVPSTFAKQEPITRVRSNSSRSVSDDRGSSITSDSRTSSFNDNSLDSLPSTEPSSTGTSPFGSQHPSTDSLPNLSEPVTPPIDGLKVGGERKPGRLNMNRWEAMKNPKPAVTSSTPELFNQKPSATMGGPEDLGYDYRTRIEDIAHQVDQKHLTS